MAFNDGFEDFKIYCIIKNLSKDTIKDYEGVIRTAFKFINLNILTKDITRKTVDQFFARNY